MANSCSRAKCLVGYHGMYEMGANEFEDSVARGLTESFHRHLYDISNVKILPQLLDGHLIHHDPTDSNVQRTVHSVLLVVLDEGLDYGVDL